MIARGDLGASFAKSRLVAITAVRIGTRNLSSASRARSNSSSTNRWSA
jgi:hypothetical protein